MKFDLMRFFKPPVLILGLIITFHLFLISKTFVIDSSGNIRTAYAGYGDIPFHMTQVSKFAFHKHADLNEPIFDGERMRYAFLVNALSGEILRFSGSWPMAMQLPSMSLMSIATFLTFLSYRNFLKSSYGALTALVIFLLGAGFGANQYFYKYLDSPSRSSSFVQYLVDNSVTTTIQYDAVYPDQNIVWGAPMSLVFLHQRAFFLGFFIFSIFWYFFVRWQRNPENKLTTALLGIAVGVGPLAHFHTFIVMCIILAVAGLFAIKKKNFVLLKGLIRLVFIALLIALPQIIYLVSGKSSFLLSDNSFMKFRLGWMTEETIGAIKFNPAVGFFSGRILPILNFSWLNFGIILPIFITAGVFIIRSSEFRHKFRQILFLASTGSVLFLIVQLYRFQPWDFDNNKILVYFQFFAAPVFVAFFLWIRKKRKWLGTILFVLFTTIAIYSGLIDQVPRLLVPFDKLPVIFNADAIAIAEFIKTNVPFDEKIITTSTHLNPVDSLAGRPVIVGYPGWLWTKGISYGARENDLKKIFADPVSNINIANKYGAKYALVDSTATHNWGVSLSTFDQNYTLLFKSGSYYLYRLSQ